MQFKAEKVFPCTVFALDGNIFCTDEASWLFLLFYSPHPSIHGASCLISLHSLHNLPNTNFRSCWVGGEDNQLCVRKDTSNTYTNIALHQSLCAEQLQLLVYCRCLWSLKTKTLPRSEPLTLIKGHGLGGDSYRKVLSVERGASMFL